MNEQEIEAARKHLRQQLFPFTQEERLQLVQRGALTINEFRIQAGLGPIEGGDVAFVVTPTGAVPVSHIADYFAVKDNA